MSAHERFRERSLMKKNHERSSALMSGLERPCALMSAAVVSDKLAGHVSVPISFSDFKLDEVEPEIRFNYLIANILI